MSRRDSSLFGSTFDAFTTLPWWASIIGIAAVLLLFNVIIARVCEPMSILGPAVAVFSRFIGSALAVTIGIAGLISWLKELAATKKPHRVPTKSYASIHTPAKQRKSHLTPQDFQGMPWLDFERLVADTYRKLGYSVVERGGAHADGGIDLIAIKDGRKVLVQCKYWKAWQVGVKEVRELYGVLMHEGAAEAHLVTSGTFTAEAHDFTRGKPLTLVDGTRLGMMIEQPPAQSAAVTPVQPAAAVTPAQPAPSQPVDAPRQLPLTPKAPAVSESDMLPPVCPRCGSQMIMRTATRGSNAGSPFWGCSTYPKCRGIVEISQRVS